MDQGSQVCVVCEKLLNEFSIQKDGIEGFDGPVTKCLNVANSHGPTFHATEGTQREMPLVKQA